MAKKGGKLSKKHKLAIKASYTSELREVHRQIMLKRYTDPKERELQSQRMTEALDDPDVRKRMSDGQKNKEKNPAQWANMHKVRKGSKMSDEQRAAISKRNKGNSYHLGHINTPEARELMSIIKRGKTQTMATRKKRSRTIATLWKNPYYRDRMIRASRQGMSVYPNVPETRILELLNEIDPNNWKFTGDGTVVMGGRIPDFYNVNGYKKIIEVFGDYWHGEKARCYEETEEGRVEYFRKYGHRCLVIWENELRDEVKVREKIKDFVGCR